MALTLREQVKKMVGEDEELKPEEFSNLILDELKITHLTEDDKAFLEEFTHLELLAMNLTGIKSLQNLPDAPDLVRIEVTDNHLAGTELRALVKYTKLATIKFGNNNVKEFEELQPLTQIENLMSLDLASNPIQEKEGYRDKVFELLPKLQILDGQTREGEEYVSDDEEGESDYGEELPGDAEEGEDSYGGEDLEDEAELGEDEYDDEYDDEEGDDAALGKREHSSDDE